MKFVFKKTQDSTNPYDTTNITHESDAESLDNVLEDIAGFLRGCGYVIPYNQQLAFITDEEEK